MDRPGKVLVITLVSVSAVLWFCKLQSKRWSSRVRASKNTSSSVDELIPLVVKSNYNIEKPASEIYSFLRAFENYPLLFRHLQKVSSIGPGFYLWQARESIFIKELSWKTSITEEIENKKLSWNSNAGEPLKMAGLIELNDQEGGLNGTQVKVMMSFCAPLSNKDSRITNWLNPIFLEFLKEDLNHAKGIIAGKR